LGDKARGRPNFIWNLEENKKLRCEFPGSGDEFYDTYFSNCDLDVVYNIGGIAIEVRFSAWNERFRTHFEQISYLVDNLLEIFNIRRVSQ